MNRVTLEAWKGMSGHVGAQTRLWRQGLPSGLRPDLGRKSYWAQEVVRSPDQRGQKGPQMIVTHPSARTISGRVYCRGDHPVDLAHPVDRACQTARRTSQQLFGDPCATPGKSFRPLTGHWSGREGGLRWTGDLAVPGAALFTPSGSCEQCGKTRG